MRWLVLVLAIGCSRVRTHPWRGFRTELAPVVVHEVAVAPLPGALPIGVHLEPGFPLPATVAGWLPVHAEHPIQIDGWVPASARGVFSRPVHVDTPPLTLTARTVVHAAPDAGSAVVAIVDSGVPAAIDGEVGTWAAIEAVAGRVRVTGWAIVPPPQPHTGSGSDIRTFDFDDDVIEGDLVTPEGVKD